MLAERARQYVLSLNIPPGSHDLEHVRRVLRYARKIWEKEGGDWDVLEAAVWLHDVSLFLGGQKATHHEDSARIALEVLGDEKVARIIREHRYSTGIGPSCIESAILQDADRLDALGAIGLYRTLAYGVRNGRMLYDPDDPFALSRPLMDHKYSVDHFFAKILKLPLLMNTKTGKELARELVQPIVVFIRFLERELGRDGELDRALTRHGLSYLCEFR